MIGGVNFQPGMTGQDGTQPRSKQGGSVQEAIKILSLRLPKRVGPNALAPAALLNAQGSGGNPRIDSVVNTVMGRMFPQGQPAQPPQPVAAGPQFGGDSRPAGNTPLSSMMPTGESDVARAPRISPIEGRTPGVTFENPQGPVNNEWPAQTPPPPPGSTFDGNYTRWPGSPAPTVPDQNNTMPVPPPPQRFDNNPPARPSEGSAPAAPTQDPWADLMEYIRRKGEAPQMQEDTPIR